MEVTINFTIKLRDYDQYEGILQEFLNNLSELGYDEINVMEE